MSVLRDHSHAFLLLAILFALTAQSFGHTIVGGPVATDILSSVAVVVVLLVVFERRRERYASLVVMGVLVAATLSHYFDLPGNLRWYVTLVDHGAYVVFCGFAVVVVLRGIFERTQIRTDDVLGALAGYLLGSALWANLYSFCYLLVPGSFSIASPVLADMASWHSRNALFNLFSLGTLTTMGYGEVLPVKPPATIIAMLEAVFGQFYIAVVVAQLVGLRLMHALPRK